MKMIKLLVVPFLACLPYASFAQLSIEWSKMFSGSQLDILNAVAVNGNYYEVVGTTGSADNFFEDMDMESSDVFWVKGNISDGSTEQLFFNFDPNTHLAVDIASGFNSTSPVKLLLSGYEASSQTDYINITDLDENNNTLSLTNTSSILDRTRLYRMVKGINNEFWIVGESRTGNAIVYKWDELEGLLWQKEFGGSNEDIATSVVALDNGDVVVAAYGGSSDGDVGQNFGNTDPWLFKLNNDGQVLWSKVLGTSNLEYTFDLKPTFDDGFVLTAIEVFLTDTGSEQQGKVIKTDSEGNIVWTYDGSNLDAFFTYFYTVIPLPDRSYLIAGHQSLLDNAGSIDLLFVLLDQDGNFIWKQTFGGSQEDVLQDIVQIDEQCFLVASSSSSSDGDLTENAGLSDGWLFKLCMDDLSTSTQQVDTTSEKWFVFPSPAKAGQILHLQKAEGSAFEEVRVQLLNAQGQLLANSELLYNSQNSHYTLPQNLPQGKYWLRIQEEAALTVKSIIIIE